jgi:serine/threonine protein kinase
MEILRDRIKIVNKNDIEIKQKIGEGGFGNVYQAKFQQRNCVVKVFSEIEEYITKSPERNTINFFLNEILNAAVLKSEHPNVLPLLACCCDIRELPNDKNKRALLVFPYIEGGDLEGFITNGKMQEYLNTKPNEKEKQIALLQFCLQISEGIEFLHSQNLSHCDLKPQNILVDVNYDKNSIRPIISDYGISILMGNKTLELTNM